MNKMIRFNSYFMLVASSLLLVASSCRNTTSLIAGTCKETPESTERCPAYDGEIQVSTRDVIRIPMTGGQVVLKGTGFPMDALKVTLVDQNPARTTGEVIVDPAVVQVSDLGRTVTFYAPPRPGQPGLTNIVLNKQGAKPFTLVGKLSYYLALSTVLSGEQVITKPAPMGTTYQSIYTGTGADAIVAQQDFATVAIRGYQSKTLAGKMPRITGPINYQLSVPRVGAGIFTMAPYTARDGNRHLIYLASNVNDVSRQAQNCTYRATVPPKYECAPIGDVFVTDMAPKALQLAVSDSVDATPNIANNFSFIIGAKGPQDADKDQANVYDARGVKKKTITSALSPDFLSRSMAVSVSKGLTTVALLGTVNNSVEIWSQVSADSALERAAPVQLGNESAPQIVLQRDVDGDGFLDLIVVGNYVSLFFGDGADSFHAAPAAELGFSAVDAKTLTLGDMDRDGLPDLIFSTVVDGQSTLVVFLNTGSKIQPYKNSQRVTLPMATSPIQMLAPIGQIDEDADGVLHLTEGIALGFVTKDGATLGMIRDFAK